MEDAGPRCRGEARADAYHLTGAAHGDPRAASSTWRLDTGAITLKRDWYPVEEIVGSVLTRMRARLEGRPVEVHVPAGLPLVKLDAVMIEQVLVNLLENALKYTPVGSPLEFGAEATASTVTIWVADRGPGIPPGEEERLFEKFHRAAPERAQSGVGLGLRYAAPWSRRTAVHLGS